MRLTKDQLIFLIESTLKGGIDPIPGREGYNVIAQGMNAMLRDKKKKRKEEMLTQMQDYGYIAMDDFESHFKPQMGTQYDDYSSEKGRAAKELRRKPKQMWNQYADHDFFKNKIAKVHKLGYAGGRKKRLSTSYLGGGNTELSIYGTKSNTPLKPTPEEFGIINDPYGRPSGFGLYIVLDGRCTWAGDFDAFTEELGSHKGDPHGTREYAKQKTKSSGMPKRPGGVRLFDDMEDNLETFPILLDEEDVDNMDLPRIEEAVIDNWKIVSLTLFNAVPDLSFNSRSIEELAVLANDLHINHRFGSPYHTLKLAIQDGYPNPRVCDYHAGRYWTDQEIQELFSLLK